MKVELQPDPNDRMVVTVHTTFDEHDGGQHPQPWRLYINGALHDHLTVDDADCIVTLPKHGFYNFKVISNTASVDRLRYYTGTHEAGKPGAPFSLDSVTPNEAVAGGADWPVLTFKGKNLDLVYTFKAVGPSGNGPGGGVTHVDNQTVTGQLGQSMMAETGVGSAFVIDNSVSPEVESNRLPFKWGTRNFVDFTPKSAPLGAALDIVCTGEFGDPQSALSVEIFQPALGGTKLASTSVTKTSDSEIIGHFADTGAMAAGDAQVVVNINPPGENYYPGSGFITFA